MLFYDIHRHDEFSLFDGFGSAKEVAKQARKLGYKACGSTNHGNITGLIKHFKACKENEIIPILGCEFYFQPKINHEKKYFHLCIYAKNMEGWKNLNKLITISNSETHFYYKNKICFEDLKKYHEGLICSSACIGGIIASALDKGKKEKAIEFVDKFVEIFGKDFFLEIQPIELKGEGEKKGIRNRQIVINEKIIKIGKEKGIETITTSDSHFVKEEDFSTYLKLHEIKKSTIGLGYSERYMQTEKDIEKKIRKYHLPHEDYLNRGMHKFLKRIGDSRDWFKFEPDMPKFTESKELSYEKMKKKAIKFLKEKDKFDEKYKKRLKHELDVVKYHGFQDYFMIVQDYVNWAKKSGIAVGPGRGSAGNSLLNYALGITIVDPVLFGNDFNRFLRKDKKKFPDIDCDFCRDNRDKVIKYIIDKYKGKSAQTLTYGKYNVKNLINDLGKVCNCTDPEALNAIKKFLLNYCNDSENTINEKLYDDYSYKKFNSLYDNIITHFVKLYGKVRYFGTHASAVILSSSPITDTVGLCRIGGNLKTSFDLHDIEFLGLLKLDILGLSSATQAKQLEKITDVEFSEEMLNDRKTLEMFNKNPIGVFQFESRSSFELIKLIGIDSFEDVVASVALNRPGPLSLGMHEKYAQNKKEPPINAPWYKFTKETYGTLIYQEQVISIAKEIGGFSPADADQIAKHDTAHIPKEEEERFRKIFMNGAKNYGLKKAQAEELFRSMVGYSFNRGHAVAYAMLSTELGYFKTHFPDEFWFVTMKYEGNEETRFRDEAIYIENGGVIFLPHVNGSLNYSLKNINGEKVIMKGLTSIKNVGEKAAQFIIDERKKNGKFTDIFEFEKRCKNRSVTSRVIDALEDAGALQFNKKKYLREVERYNTSIMAKRR